MDDSLGIVSPCTGVCFISPDLDICYGCLRSMQEIESWAAYSKQERAQIMASLEARRETLPEELR